MEWSFITFWEEKLVEEESLLNKYLKMFNDSEPKCWSFILGSNIQREKKKTTKKLLYLLCEDSKSIVLRF